MPVRRNTFVLGLNSGLTLETESAHGEFIRFHELCL
jgi:hypothetical protein